MECSKKYQQWFEHLHFPFTWRHLVAKILTYFLMFLIFSMPVSIRHLWQLKSVAFLCRCLIHALLLLLWHKCKLTVLLTWRHRYLRI